ncbi:hypothetical protein ACFL6C_10870 [Myxococcota bacterium]
MSSTGGGSGVGGRVPVTPGTQPPSNTFTILDTKGIVQIPNGEVDDLTNADQVARAKKTLTAEQLAVFEDMLLAVNFKVVVNPNGEVVEYPNTGTGGAVNVDHKGMVHLADGSVLDLNDPDDAAIAQRALTPEQLETVTLLQRRADFKILDANGKVQIPNGEVIDLTDAEQVAHAKTVLTAEQLETLEDLMLAVNFKLEGDTFVRQDAAALHRALGPTSTTEGMSMWDEEIAEQVFGAAGFANPYNANTTENLYAQIQGTPQFQTAVAATTDYLENASGSTSVNASTTQDFITRLNGMMADFPEGNIMEVLFLVFRESIQQTNEDKKYFLIKLQEFNKMAEKISEYLSELVDKSQDLSVKSEGQKYPEKVHINVDCKTFDLSTLDKNGNLCTTSTDTKSLDRAGLNDTIKEVESMQETVRNKRQMASTAFQNFDQKANQLYNLMASVLKSLNEMRSGTTRNMM